MISHNEMAMQSDKLIYPGLYPYADEWPRLLRGGTLKEERSVRAEVMHSLRRFGTSLLQACRELKYNLAGAVRLAQTKGGRHFSRSSLPNQRWWHTASRAEWDIEPGSDSNTTAMAAMAAPAIWPSTVADNGQNNRGTAPRFDSDAATTAAYSATIAS